MKVTENFNLTDDIIQSKNILNKKLNTNIDTFVYPFGKMNKQIHNKITEHYKYAMRIGSSINKNWNNLIYRIDADYLWQNNIKISNILLAKLKFKY